MARWVMTERKLVRVSVVLEKHGGHLEERTVEKFFNPGDPVPPGHEGRPYTRLEQDEHLADTPAVQDVPDTASPASRRGRARKVRP